MFVWASHPLSFPSSAIIPVQPATSLMRSRNTFDVRPSAGKPGMEILTRFIFPRVSSKVTHAAPRFVSLVQYFENLFFNLHQSAIKIIYIYIYLRLTISCTTTKPGKPVEAVKPKNVSTRRSATGMDTLGCGKPSQFESCPFRILIQPNHIQHMVIFGRIYEPHDFGESTPPKSPKELMHCGRKAILHFL